VAALSLGLLVPAVSVLAYRIFRDPRQAVPPRIEVRVVPASLRLDAGTPAELRLQLSRHNFTGPVHLSCPGRPPGVNIPEADLAAGADEVVLPLSADRAARGVRTITVTARGEGVQESVDLQLTVLALPPGCAKDSDAMVPDADGVPYYKEISRALADGTRVQFLLVPRKPPADRRDGKGDPVPTFYIMRDKVTLGLFRRFAAAHGLWASTARGAGRKREPPDWALPVRAPLLGALDLLPAPVAPGPLLAAPTRAGWDQIERCPVLDVTAEEAHAFAEGLGGLLPTAGQWDKAAGCSERDRGEGPYVGSWKPGPGRPDVAVGLSGPRPVGASRDDRSPLGCRDMAGNGYELTRTTDRPPQEVPLPRGTPRDDLNVLLRGQGFRSSDRPLTYDDLNAPPPWPYGDPLPEGGFRVVIEP
jgi:hypothetical protein